MLKKSIQYNSNGDITSVVTFDDEKQSAPVCADAIIVNADVDTDSGRVNTATKQFEAVTVDETPQSAPE